MKIYADGGFKKKTGGYGSFRIYRSGLSGFATKHLWGMAGWTDTHRDFVIKTHNEAEYMTLVEALTWYIERADRDPRLCKNKRVHVYMDSLLVVNQVNRKWQIKSDTLRIFLEEVWALVKLLDDFTITHVPREKIVAILGH